MKKTLLIALLPLLLISIGTSSCSDTEKVALIYGREVDNKLVEIKTYGDLESKIEDKENFLLTVYSSGGCSCWSTFEHMVMENYNATKHTLIYKINYNLFFDGETSLNTYGLSIRNDRATIAIFKDGTLFSQEVYQEGNKIFTSSDYFGTWLEGKVYLPTIFYISKAQLDAKYSETNDFVIEFMRNSCPDCTYLNKHMLKDYGASHLDMDAIYAFDTDEVRLDASGNVDTEKWNAFKDEYGLSNVNNTKFGYNSGYVPTFFKIRPTNNSKTESIISAACYFNDSIAKVEDHYEVAQSFYSASRLDNIIDWAQYCDFDILEGLIIPEADITIYGETYFAWNHDKASVYHDPLLKAFLNDALGYFQD